MEYFQIRSGMVDSMGSKRQAGHLMALFTILVFYGILFMIPPLFLFDFEIGLERLADMTHLLNILYLGLGASALCFVTWNLAVKALGAVKTSVYIYIVPVITVVTSVLILKEPVTWASIMGTVLAVAGLFLSEYNGKVV